MDSNIQFNSLVNLGPGRVCVLNLHSGLEKAHRDTQLWALELWEVKDDDNKFKEVLGCDMDEEESDDDPDGEIPKPVKPVFSMSVDENAAYHTILLHYLYKKEGIEQFKLWSKMEDGDVIICTTLSNNGKF